MERDSPAPRGTSTSDVTTAAPAAAAADQQEQLRQALLSAADEEAAAIVEQARRDITVAVRRARRDLHLIRAQLHLCGVELPASAAAGSIGDGRSSLDEAVPHDAITVGRTHSLRHVVTEASQELSQLTAAVGTTAPSAAVSGPAAPPGHVGRSTFFIAACAVAAMVAGGAIGWVVIGGADRFGTPESSTAAASAGTLAGSPVSEPRPDKVVSGDAMTRPQLTGTPSRIVVQTVRPVWMRIDIDGTADAGRLYPEGAIRELTPAREVLIRAGDAGAVLVGVGGESPAPLGQAGQVLTRRISIGQPQASPAVASNDAASPPDAPAQGTAVAPAAGAPVAPAPLPGIAQSNPVVPDVQRSEVAASPVASGPATGQTHAEILAKHERWLDAYSRGDQESIRTLTADGFSVRDERSAAEKTGSVQEPDVSEVRIDVAGIGAVLTGRLRTVIDGVPNESLLSEVWVRDGQQRWALMGVRITPIAR